MLQDRAANTAFCEVASCTLCPRFETIYSFYFSRSPWISLLLTWRISQLRLPVSAHPSQLPVKPLGFSRVGWNSHPRAAHFTGVNAPTGLSLTFEGLSDVNCSILYPCCNSLKLCFTPAFCSLQWAESALLLGKPSYNEGRVFSTKTAPNSSLGKLTS